MVKNDNQLSRILNEIRDFGKLRRQTLNEIRQKIDFRV